MIGEERVKKRYEGAAGLQKERAECACGEGDRSERRLCFFFRQCTETTSKMVRIMFFIFSLNVNKDSLK